MYSSISVLGLFGGIYAISMWQLDKGSAWLWTFPIAIVLFIGVFIAAKVGQKIGHEQMVFLITSLHKSLEKEKLKEFYHY